MLRKVFVFWQAALLVGTMSLCISVPDSIAKDKGKCTKCHGKEYHGNSKNQCLDCHFITH